MWYSIVKEKQRGQAKANSRVGWNGKRSDDAVTISGGTAEVEQGERVFLIYHRQIGGHSIYPTLGTLQFSRRAGSSDT